MITAIANRNLSLLRLRGGRGPLSADEGLRVGFAAEFDAFRLGVGPATRGALQDAATLQLRGGDAKDGEHDLSKVGRGVDVGFRQRTG